MNSSKAAITGLGAIAPTGMGQQPLWEALTAGSSALKPLQRFSLESAGCRIAGEVDETFLDLHVDARKRRSATRASQLALIAAALAVTDARLTTKTQANDR